MPRIRLPLTWIISICFSCCCLGKDEIIEGSTSPDGKLALSHEVPEKSSGEGEYISLVSLPKKVRIGIPIVTRDMLGLPWKGGCVWNQMAGRFAFFQGGMPWSWTMAFKYSSNSLEELAMPDFTGLPRRWFNKTTDFRQFYVIPRRWQGRDRLELCVSGIAVFNGGKVESDYFNYAFSVVVLFKPSGSSKIIRVTEES